MTSSSHRFMPRSPRLGLAALLLCLTAGGASAQTLLQAGDRLRLSIAGFPETAYQSTIGLDGTLRFPGFGTIPAANRTLQEIEQELQTRATGAPIKRYRIDGTLDLLTISAEDVFLDVAEYRPVIVTGQVAAPQSLGYRPGMTVRSAIALAGGQSVITANGFQDALQAKRLQIDYDTAALSHASEQVKLWRLDAQIAGEEDITPEDDATLRISDTLRDRLLEAERNLMEQDALALADQRNFFETSLKQTQARADLLRQQAQIEEQALQADREELERMTGLLNRGLAQASALIPVRRSVLASNTQLLDTQEDIARAEIDITRFQNQIDSLAAQRKAALLRERDATQRALLAAAARLRSLGDLVALTGQSVLDVESAGSGGVEIMLHRETVDGPVSQRASLDDQLQPGDMIEVVELN